MWGQGKGCKLDIKRVVLHFRYASPKTDRAVDVNKKTKGKQTMPKHTRKPFFIHKWSFISTNGPSKKLVKTF